MVGQNMSHANTMQKFLAVPRLLAAPSNWLCGSQVLQVRIFVGNGPCLKRGHSGIEEDKQEGQIQKRGLWLAAFAVARKHNQIDAPVLGAALGGGIVRHRTEFAVAGS